jgi:site-specific DNA recombinase
MADVYRDQIAYGTRRGLKGRARAQRPTGGKAYVYVAAMDSDTGHIEVNETEAKIVRRIYEMYADGMSPRRIAGILNEERVPSPGSSWKRTERRKSAWLASAIHADPKRGTGILANTRYGNAGPRRATRLAQDFDPMGSGRRGSRNASGIGAVLRTTALGGLCATASKPKTSM